MLAPLISVVLIVSSVSLAQVQVPMHPRRYENRGNEMSERVQDVQSGVPVFSGNACHSQNTQLVMSPDQLSFSVLFNEFVVDSGSSPSVPSFERICNVALTFNVPTGYQVELSRVDFRGFSALPEQAMASLFAMIGFEHSAHVGSAQRPPLYRTLPGAVRPVPGNPERQAQQQMIVRYDLSGPLIKDFEVSTGDMTVGSTRTQISSCGGSARLNIQTHLRLRTPTLQQAQVGLDSMDGKAQAIYYLNWRRCSLR